ncbi:MAG: UDP-N-acetylglucosamine 1-carboxyvinyltransferase, partial [Deltaproteobacteria bacterium]
MDKIVINGGKKLSGQVKISGAKNAALPVVISSILTCEENIYHNVPNLMDTKTTKRILSGLGAHIFDDGNTLKVKIATLSEQTVPYDLVRTMRASILVLGPLLARTGMAKVSLPGGCAIGARPVNLHIDALAKMGAEIELTDGYIIAKANRLKGAIIYFDIVTVTGTENIMMAATLAKGTTVLKNVAREPEVVSLAQVLNQMGANISGAGTDTITIEGVDSLHGVETTIIPDRIEAGTFMIAAAMTGSKIDITNCCPNHLT